MLCSLPFAWTQSSQPLSVAPPAKLSIDRKTTANVTLHVSLAEGYHTNSHQPSESYLIPLRLTWNPGPIESSGVVYPKPQMVKYAFADKPLSVFTGAFDIVASFQAPASASPGPGMMTGKLRYQACTHDTCLPPKTIDVKLPVVVR